MAREVCPTFLMALKAREFLFKAEDLAMKALPPGFAQPERKVMWTTLQLHYGDPRVHFELQPMPARGVVELGLHFEGPAEVNDRWAALVALHAPELMAALGEGWELEEWTASWRRLHRTWPFTELSLELAEEVSGQLARALQVLRPLVVEGLSAIPMPPVQVTASKARGGEHWRRSRERSRR